MLRVGSVPYLVARPLDTGLGEEPGIDFVRQVPAKLVAGLRDGSLDVALVSSIELFRRPGYSFLDGPAVTGEGFVSSVQVFLRRPPAPRQTIALDPASRTAATLVRIVWPARDARFLDVAPGEDPREADADAWLRIGDTALRELHAPDAPPVFNPSQAWSERTGLPFAFAVWIARPGVELEPHVPAFLRARTRGADAVAELAREAATAWELPLEETRRYLTRECIYEPGERLRPALDAFRDEAAALGLARGELEPRGVPAAYASRAPRAPRATGR